MSIYKVLNADGGYSVASKSPTPGEWTRACDSYGKVQHSRKYDCVYTVTGRNEGQAERIVTVASRIAHGPDADLIASAPDLLDICQSILDSEGDTSLETMAILGNRWKADLQAAIRKATGGRS